MDTIRKLKEWLENISSQIWSLIEVTPDVWEILGWLYEEEYLFSKSIELLKDNKYKVMFSFPEYKLVKWWLTHVSAAQMQIAIFQWLFCAIGLYIKNISDSPISFETYVKNRSNALYRRDTRTFTKQLHFHENAYLIFSIENITKKGNLYSITCKIHRSPETFMHWEVECVLEEKYL